MQGRVFSFKFLTKLTIKSVKVNEPQEKSNTNLPDLLKCLKIAKNKTKIINDRYFQYDVLLTKHHKEVKNHPKHALNTKTSTDLYNCDRTSVC